MQLTKINTMENKRGPGPIPNRWLHCPRKSADLIVGKFIAFKTPLSERFDDQVPAECRFSPKMIFEFARSKKVSRSYFYMFYFVQLSF